MGHVIEHATGIYIGLLLLACSVGALSKLVARYLPYTIALTLVGLAIGFLHLGPDIAETGLSRELIFFVLLPPLLFQGALHLELDRLLKHFCPILIFAMLGVLISTCVIGGTFFLLGTVDVLLVAMLFGAMLSPTDPVSVLAIFKEVNVPDDLRYIVEGESLFNDGTGIVLFSIILEMILGGGAFNLGPALIRFVRISAGGLLLGGGLGAVASLILKRLDDHLLENAICLVLAYGAFWLGEVAHVSGVIATVTAGLLIGNYGRRLSMSKKTSETVETFFESIDFVINSILFVLIGIELQTVSGEILAANVWPTCVAILALVISRAIAVYPLYWATNLVGLVRPRSWAHVLFWGGLRGSIPIALLLGLPKNDLLDAYRPVLLVAGFGAIFFSIVVQGLTMKPLLLALKVSGEDSNSVEEQTGD